MSLVWSQFEYGLDVKFSNSLPKVLPNCAYWYNLGMVFFSIYFKLILRLTESITTEIDIEIRMLKLFVL